MAIEASKTEKELYQELGLGKPMFGHIVIVNPRWKTMQLVEQNFESISAMKKLPKNQQESEMLQLAIKSFTEGYEVVDFCTDCRYVKEDTEKVFVQLTYQSDKSGGQTMVSPLDAIPPMDNEGKYLCVRESMFVRFK